MRGSRKGRQNLKEIEMTTFTATITEAQENWGELTIKIFEADSLAATEGEEHIWTIWTTTTAYTGLDSEDGQVDFDDAQWMADIEAAFAADGWTVVDWVGENPDGTGAIIGATVTKA